MNSDNFEKRLQRQSFRPIPAEWRQEILAAARAAGDLPRRPSVTGGAAWWREWFWPSPWAWASGAAAWALILALNLAASSGSEMALPSAVPPSVARMASVEKRLLMNSLTDAPAPDSTAPSSEPAPARSRSDRAPEWRRA